MYCWAKKLPSRNCRMLFLVDPFKCYTKKYIYIMCNWICLHILTVRNDYGPTTFQPSIHMTITWGYYIFHQWMRRQKWPSSLLLHINTNRAIWCHYICHARLWKKDISQDNLEKGLNCPTYDIPCLIINWLFQ